MGHTRMLISACRFRWMLLAVFTVTMVVMLCLYFTRQQLSGHIYICSENKLLLIDLKRMRRCEVLSVPLPLWRLSFLSAVSSTQTVAVNKVVNVTFGKPDSCEGSTLFVRDHRSTHSIPRPSSLYRMVSPSGRYYLTLSCDDAPQALVTSIDGRRLSATPLDPGWKRSWGTTKTYEISCLQWSPDERQVVIGEGSRQIRVWNWRNNHSRLIGRGLSPAWSPDGRFIAYSPEDGESAYITIVNVSTGKEKQIRLTRYRDVTSWSPDGRYILLRDDQHEILHFVDLAVVRVRDGQQVRAIRVWGESNLRELEPFGAIWVGW